VPGTKRAAWQRNIRAILSAWGQHPKNSDLRHLAYLLGTTYHETAFTMAPIREHGGIDYFYRMYDKNGDRPRIAAQLGNTRPGDGVRYCGRGFVQLTGRNNYVRAGAKLGVDLEGHPDLAMDAHNAANIAIEGMLAGWFTGRKLSDFFRGAKADWLGARWIINGTDKASEIAGYARKFYAALMAATTEDPATPEAKPVGVMTTNIAATGVSVAGGITAVNGVRDGVASAADAARTVADVASTGRALLPWIGWNTATLSLVLGVAIILLAAYIIRERLAKREFGV
jgi:putative chitinase